MQRPEEMPEQPNDPQFPSKIRGVLSRFSIFAFRTPFERSEYPCLENIIRGTAKSFGLAIIIKVAFSLLPILMNPKKIMKDPTIFLKKILSISHLKSGVFAGSMTLVLKTIIMLCRLIRNKDDGWNGFAAGFLAGYISMFFVGQKKSFLATLLLARGVECLYNHGVSHGYFKKRKLHWVIIYNLLMTFVFYACYCERWLLPPGSESGFDTVATQPPNELLMLRMYHEIRRRDLVNMKTIVADPYLVSG